jgi:hypothetical protein
MAERVVQLWPVGGTNCLARERKVNRDIKNKGFWKEHTVIADAAAACVRLFVELSTACCADGQVV